MEHPHDIYCDRRGMYGAGSDGVITDGGGVFGGDMSAGVEIDYGTKGESKVFIFLESNVIKNGDLQTECL